MLYACGQLLVSRIAKYLRFGLLVEANTANTSSLAKSLTFISEAMSAKRIVTATLHSGDLGVHKQCLLLKVI